MFKTINFLLKKCKFAIHASLSPLEMAAMYLAAAVHDYEHP